jgi:hypothetical protein
MKILLVAGAVLAVIGAGGMTGSVLTAGAERPPVTDDASQEPVDEPTDDTDDTDDTDEGSGKPDDEAKAAQHAAQRAFVAAKQEWTACVGEAAPAHEPGSGPFDPEEACGPKPHPHDGETDGETDGDAEGETDEGPGASGEDRGHGAGRPDWAGGPDRRTAEPPGHAAHDRASKGR